MTARRAIILKTNRLNEADLIVQSLTEDGHLRSDMAKSALKSRKRFGGGVLEPTHLVELSIQEAKGSSVWSYLSEAKLIESFPNLRTDYDRLHSAFKYLEWTRKTAAQIDNSELFKLMYQVLVTINSAKLKEPVIELAFAIRFLHIQGMLKTEEWMRVFMQSQDRNRTFDELKLNSMLVVHRQMVEEFAGSQKANADYLANEQGELR